MSKHVLVEVVCSVPDEAPGKTPNEWTQVLWEAQIAGGRGEGPSALLAAAGLTFVGIADVRQLPATVKLGGK